MFEFHGWATINYHTHDVEEPKQAKCCQMIEQHLRSFEGLTYHLQSCNGLDSLLISGLHNHRSERIIELFRWLAKHAGGSYGLLYVRDGEDEKRGKDYTNEFRVWKLCRGSLTECADPFLSPAIPTVEDPYDASRGD